MGKVKKVPKGSWERTISKAIHQETNELKRFALSASHYRDARNCLRYFWWRRVMYYKPRTPQVNLMMGSAFHAGAADFLRGRPMVRCEKSIQEDWDKNLSNSFISGPQEKRIEIAKVTCLGAFRGWAQVCPLEGLDIVQVEDFYEIKLDEGLYINGTIDAVVKGETAGTIVVVDHKFTGQLQNYDPALLPLDAQAMCYPFGLSQKYGRQVRKFTLDLVRKPSISQRQGETYVEFLDRLVNDYTDRPDFYFVQRSALYNMRHLDLFRAEITQFMRELRDKIIAVKSGTRAMHELFGRNGDYCNRYGRCLYAPLCIRGETVLTRRMYDQRKDVYDLDHE